MEGEEAILETVARGGEASTSGREDGSSHETSSRPMLKRLAFLRAQGDREWHRLGNAVIRGAGAGLLLKGGLNLLSWVLAIFSKSRRRHLWANPLKMVVEQVLDTLRYTLFLASLSGVYVGSDEGIAVAFGRKR